MALIVCKDLTIGYNNIPVLHNINFSIEEADYMAITGENGSGKTTLMKAILGLEQPISGSISLEGGLRSNEIGYLPQHQASRRDFPASVDEIVLSGRLNNLGMHLFYSAEDKKKAQENMRLLGIEHLSGRCFQELSDGQQQRVLLARALCSTHKLLFMDEPVASMDPDATRDFYQAAWELNTEHSIGIVMITHNIEAVLRYAKHVLTLEDDSCIYRTVDEYRESLRQKER